MYSEKLDGVRCLWTGKQLLTRKGHKLAPPDFFTRGFPNSALDGELYLGRGKYNELLEGLKSKKEEFWMNLTYCVFDAPNLNLQFSQRYSLISQIIPQLKTEFIRLIPHLPARNMDNTKDVLKKIEEQNGEGIVLRNPRALYEHKRSWGALKFKSYQEFDGIVKSLDKDHTVVEWQGKEIKAATNLSKLTVGARVTVRYEKTLPDGSLHRPVAFRIC